MVRGGETLAGVEGGAARPHDRVVWLATEDGGWLPNGRPELGPTEAGRAWPVSPGGWVRLTNAGTITVMETPEWLGRTDNRRDLACFHRLARRWVDLRLAGRREAEKARLAARMAGQARARRDGVGSLAGLLSPGDRDAWELEGTHDPLWRAVRRVARELGVTLAEEPGGRPWRAGEDPSACLARLPRLRPRRVMLRGEWWRWDSGPLLAFRQEDGTPVALLRGGSSRYELAGPGDGRRVPVDESVAAALSPTAFTFHPTFGEQSLRVGDVFRFSFEAVRGDLWLVVVLTLAGVGLGLVAPVVTGLVFDQVIPAADRRQLGFLAAALGVAAFTDILMDVTRAVAIVRVETRSETRMQAAVWDRLLRLPLPFFRDYTAGDLANRALGIDGIRRMLTGAMMGSLLSGLFSLVSFALLCYYSVKLSLVACGLVAVNLVVTAVVSAVSLRLERPVYQVGGRLSGQILQFITGITKLRVAGAEAHAFEVWARDFSLFKRLDLRCQRLANLHGVFQGLFPLFTSMVLFWAMTSLVGDELSIGRFLAFSAAFLTFLNATIDASGSLLALVGAVPLYERTRPILEACPEPTEGKVQPGAIEGRIELSHVHFRYQPGQPLVLHDLSLHIEPGEFVAIVGPSGSGKSTLTRLLLGFEKPESGTILLDGLDLAGLDIQKVRQQFGVVLQAGRLMPGDIFRNIVGTSARSLDDAWEAARLAGLEDDIRQMPMGMHTVLGEGSSTLSGGQRQRLMIARAIVNRPRVLIFDEATSALDNRTQGVVSRSLENLKVTRLVIAHRLSTIQSADRIHVIEKGHLVQTGTFAGLRDQPGPFAELMRRQMA